MCLRPSVPAVPTLMTPGEPFFSSHGYAGYMDVYFILMKSDRDADLPWPFTKRYTFVLVDQQHDLSQRQNVEKALVPNGQDAFRGEDSASI